MLKSVLTFTFLLYISTGLVFLGYADRTTQREKPIATYPNWFWQTPNLSFLTAVGYASIDSSHPNKAQEDAIDDGIERLAKSVRVRIRAEQSFINEEFTRKVQEETDTRIKEHVRDTHKLLATYYGDGLTIVLLGLGEATNGLVGATNLFTPVATASPSVPDWFLRLPSQPGYTYAPGYASGANHTEQPQEAAGWLSKNAWSEAEKNARVELALGRETVFHTLRESFSVSSTDVILNDIETVARWYAPAERGCYVLIRAPVPETKE